MIKGLKAAVTRAHRNAFCLTTAQVAVGQNQWYHFGVGAPPILVYFSGDWDVHWRYGLLPHGQVRTAAFFLLDVGGAAARNFKITLDLTAEDGRSREEESWGAKAYPLHSGQEAYGDVGSCVKLKQCLIALISQCGCTNRCELKLVFVDSLKVRRCRAWLVAKSGKHCQYKVPRPSFLPPFSRELQNRWQLCGPSTTQEAGKRNRANTKLQDALTELLVGEQGPSTTACSLSTWKT